MEVIRGLDRLPPDSRNGVVVLGFFDGFHLGHQALINKGRGIASATRAPFLLYTFDRHPLEIVDPARAPLLLSTLEEKISLAQTFPINYFLIGQFDEALSRLAPHDFLKEVLTEKLRAQSVVAGYNYRYGKNHQGNAETLLAEAPSLGFSAEIVDAVMANGEAISSSRIRTLLADGKMEEAARLLGRRYPLSGVVVKGDGRGKTLGVPTANLRTPPGKLIPRIGIYAAIVQLEGSAIQAVVSIGKRPTFGGTEVVVEVHLLDFNHDLYGETLQVEFAAWIRDEEKFESKEDLVKRMQEDIQKGRDILKIYAG